MACEAFDDIEHGKEAAKLALRTILQAQGPDHPIVPYYIGIVKAMKKRSDEQLRAENEIENTTGKTAPCA